MNEYFPPCMERHGMAVLSKCSQPYPLSAQPSPLDLKINIYANFGGCILRVVVVVAGVEGKTY